LAREPHPSTVDQTTTVAPSGIGKRKKSIALGTKRKQDQALTDQVIIELPPYHKPRSPLDLVVVKHIFGCLFESFRLTCQAARTDTSVGGDAQPSKKARAPSLKKMIVPKYAIILLVYSSFNFDLHSDIMVVHRESSVSGQPKPTFTHVTAPKTVAPVAAAVASSSVGGTGWTVLSTADA
jgi:hypothetical protein